MGNEQFNDVGILNTLASLERSGMLHDEDRQDLIERLSPWGKERADQILKSAQESKAAPKHISA
jgi:hypothetical protein